MSNDIAVTVSHVSKTFKLPHDKAASVKGNLIRTIQRKRGYEIQHALEDINFEVKKGEFYGIVGKNGGGKSTLLKVISGIYAPTKGGVSVSGKLTPFIELGVGFNPELTGRENVFLNGALLGFNRKEMQAMYEDIVAFAELGRFMDQKLKNYSSGMQVRLAFSIAIRAESDILVMDEVLAVGDAAFQKKCFDVFRELKKQGRTIILVTHDMANVERFCDRVLVIDKGKQLTVTTPAKASSIYARLNVSEEAINKNDLLADNTKIREGNGVVIVEDVQLYSGQKSAKIFNTGEDLTVELTLKRDEAHSNVPLVCGLSFHDSDDHIIAGPNSLLASIKPDATEVSFTMANLTLAPGDYKITTAVFGKDMEVFDLIEKWINFSVISDRQIPGFVDLRGEWSSRKGKDR